MGAHVQRRDSESSVDDLRAKRGVVLGRAVTTLRSVETQPSLGGFVMKLCRASARTKTSVREFATAGRSLGKVSVSVKERK
jgi:hypothetical protein